MADSRLSSSSVIPPDDVDRLLDTTAAWTQHLFHRMADAFMSADGDAPLALHRALATMLREIADTPEMAYLATVDLPSLGPCCTRVATPRSSSSSTFLDLGLAELPEPPADRDAIALCITGGLWETVRRYALEHRLHELPDALPGMSYFAFRPSSGPTTHCAQAPSRSRHLALATHLEGLCTNGMPDALQRPLLSALTIALALCGLLASSAGAATWFSNGDKTIASTNAGAIRLVVHNGGSQVVLGAHQPPSPALSTARQTPGPSGVERGHCDADELRLHARRISGLQLHLLDRRAGRH